MHSSTSSHGPPIRVITSLPSSAQPDSTEETPLLGNAWSSSENFQARHPGIHGAISSPILPSEAQLSSESPKPPNPRSSTHDNLHTHPNLQQTPTIPHPERPFTPTRHSISRMMPGPLLSPLSGGLSVIIADSLRRGVESPIRSRPSRRSRLSQRPTSGSEDVLGSSSDAAHNISRSLEPESSWSRITRTRSLSNTLGDLFRRQRTERSTDNDEEAGPSES